jgi:acetate---CoA ligase (ADP-forming)
VADLHRMLAARSVAVVGASARSGSFGERLAIEALRSPGVASVHLVNPAYAEVQGRRCLPSLTEVDEPVDLVLFGVPDRLLPDQLAQAGELGAGAGVVFGSAVGLADRIRVSAAGMAVCGAGCMGFVNLHGGVRALGYLERPDLTPGGIGLITHSGSMFSALLRSHRRLEFSTAISSGQELVTTTGDYLMWLVDQPETRVVGLFLETIRDADLVRAGLARAAELDLPVVALTVGGSAAGMALVTAHSGAVAGADAAWEALFATYGVHRCRDVEEFVDTLELFAIGRRPRPSPSGAGRGIATVHDSGAERVLLADLAAAEGVAFAEIGRASREELARHLDDGLLVTNPLDVWGRGADTETLFRDCLTTLVNDPNTDLVALAVDLVTEYDGDESYPRAVAAVAARTNKPVVMISQVAAAVDQGQASHLRNLGIPVLEGGRSGLRAIGHLLEHARSLPTTTTPLDSASASPPVDGEPQRVLPAWLDASGSLALLAEYGIPVVPTRAADSAERALAAAERLGFPVVLKTDEPGIEHRARVGGVHLGLSHADAVRRAYAALAGRCGPAVVVQPDLRAGSAQPPTEIALGVVRDPAVGLIAMVSRGGSRIEEVGQRVLALTPLDPSVIAGLLSRWERLTGLGAAPGLAEALRGLGALLDDLGSALSAVDVNPLLVLPEGVIAVDALVQVQAAP